MPVTEDKTDLNKTNNPLFLHTYIKNKDSNFEKKRDDDLWFKYVRCLSQTALNDKNGDRVVKAYNDHNINLTKLNIK